jgi:hypothetical protein
MFLDGFSGDTLSQAAAMSRELLQENDPVRRILAKVGLYSVYPTHSFSAVYP